MPLDDLGFKVVQQVIYSQRAQYPLVKEYTLKFIGGRNIL